MTAQEIYQDLIRSSLNIRETDTCDGLIVGDPDKEVHRIGTCFKLTMSLIRKALELRLDMIITHEPTFCREDPCSVFKGIDEKRFALLQESGLTVYRYHDHAHDREPDYIHAGFLDAVGLKIRRQFPLEAFAVRRYELEEETTTRALALQVKERLGLENVRLVDGEDRPVKIICLGLGWVNSRYIRAFADMDSQLYITGELDEVFSQEYIRDAAFFGMNKSILLLGHYGAEFAGMRLLAEDLNKHIAPTVFLDGREVYHFI